MLGTKIFRWIQEKVISSLIFMQIKGMIGYLVGDVAYGKYYFICKSVDPGIALATYDNLMCKGQKDRMIDYTTKFPTINECLCINQSIIPATRNKRKHVECDNIYYELVSGGL